MKQVVNYREMINIDYFAVIVKIHFIFLLLYDLIKHTYKRCILLYFYNFSK